MKNALTALALSGIMLLTGCAQMQEQVNSVRDSLPQWDGIKTALTPKTEAPSADCPTAKIALNHNQIHQFMGPRQGGAADATKISSVEISALNTRCKITATNIIVDLQIAFTGTLEPHTLSWQTGKPTFAYPYFIAITNNAGQILAKEVFALSLIYDRNKESTTKVENMRQVIPRTGSFGNDPELFIGFQLTDEALNYNRRLSGDSADKPVHMPAYPVAPIKIIPDINNQNETTNLSKS